MKANIKTIASAAVISSAVLSAICRNSFAGSNAYQPEPVKKDPRIIYGINSEDTCHDSGEKAGRYTEEDITVLSRLLYGEARGFKSEMRKAAVIWCVLNRVDDDRWSGNICDVVAQKYQFGGYRKEFPVEDDLKSIVIDVLERWEREKDGEKDTGRVLPENYQFFCGGYGENWFYRYEDFGKKNKTYYDWSLPNPYET